MFNAKQNELMLRAVDLLNEADALIQQALGDSDVTWETHMAIQEIADDLLYDIQDNNPEDMDAQ